MVQSQVYSTTKIGFYSRHGHRINNLRTFITENTNGKELRKYIQEKMEWEDEEFDMIDWRSIEKTLNGYTEYKQTRIVQLMFRWQYVGGRKQLMEEDDGFCPAGCGCIEDSLHYMHCEAREMVVRRTKHKSLLIKQMRAILALSLWSARSARMDGTEHG